jgi:hypothetical protein
MFYSLNLVKVAFLPFVVLPFVLNFAELYPEFSTLLQKHSLKDAQEFLEFASQQGNIKKKSRRAAVIYLSGATFFGTELHFKRIVDATEKPFQNLVQNPSKTPEWASSE